MSTPSNDNTFRVLNKIEYVRELTERVAAAERGERVMAVTHTFDPTEPPIAHLVDELIAAAMRGVEVSLAIDARVLPLVGNLRATRKSRRIFLAIKRTLERLQAAGGRYVITNQTRRRLLNPYAGRSHIKLALVNDDVYVGGCNLDQMLYMDMMVRWHDHTAANWLYEHMRQVVSSGNVQTAMGAEDQELTLDAETKLLLDVGRPGQSLIYERALRLIDEAQEWVVLTCQFFPNSTTIQHLAAAYKRGVNISLYYNHPGKHRPGHNLLHQVVLMHERRRHPAALFDHQLHTDTPFLHAKLLASEKGVMIGSHNYVAASVNFGTAELTLLRHDPTLAHRAVEGFLKQLAATHGPKA